MSLPPDQCCARDKYWYEMDDKEKIEKLMRELERTQFKVQDLSKLVSRLYEHEHASDGHMVAKIKVPGEESYPATCFRAERFCAQKP